jgi:hypothetical protein
MAVINALAEQFVAVRPLAESPTKYTYPTDGLIAKWTFDTDVPYMASELNNPNHILLKTDNAMVIPSMLDGGRDGYTWKDSDGSDTTTSDVNITAASAVKASGIRGWFRPEELELLPNMPGTVSMWIKTDWEGASSRGCQAIFFNSHEYRYSTSQPLNYAPNGSYTGGFAFFLAQNLLVFDVITGSGGYRRLTTDIAGLSYGYHNIVGMHTGRYLRLYIDGVLKAEHDLGSYGNGFFYNPSYRLRVFVSMMPTLNNYSAYQHRSLDGHFAEIAVWDRPLAPAEVQALFIEKEYAPGVVDQVSINEVATYGAEYIEELLTSFSLDTLAKIDWSERLTERVDTLELLGYVHGTDSYMPYHEKIVETQLVSTTLSVLRGFFMTLVDLANTTDSVVTAKGLRELALEQVLTSASIASKDVFTALELVRMSSSASAAGSLYNRALAERVTAKATIKAAWLLMAQEGVLLDAGELSVQRILELVETIRATGAVKTIGELSSSIAVAIALSETSAAGKGGFASDEIAATAEVLSRAAFYTRQIEQLILEATGTVNLVLNTLLPETIEVEARQDVKQLLSALLTEGVAFRFSFDGGEFAYTGWAMNTETFAVSEYESYPFNSFAKIGDAYFGANNKGLYELSGDSDDGTPIEAFARLGLTDFGAETQKRLDSAYLGFRVNGEMVLKIETEDGTERWYKVRGDSERLHRERVHPIGKGLRSVWWQFELANIDGADFEFEYIEFTPLVMARSI